MTPIIVNVDVNINDVVTPKSCSYLVCELIKYLIYEQEQIPYTYDRLKYLITKRKELLAKATFIDDEEVAISSHLRIAAERHYTQAEETFNNLENVFKNLEIEMLSTDAIDEVVLLFGSTPFLPQNIFRINIPLLAFGHDEKQHPSRKHIPLLFRALVSSEGLSKVFKKKLSPTNMFILLKTKGTLHPATEMFLKKDGYDIRVKNSEIKFSLKNDMLDQSCCCNESGFPIFCDTPSRHSNVVGDVIYTHTTNSNEASSSTESDSCRNDDCSDYDWFQFSNSIKGFKDFKVAGKSVANLWHKYTMPYSLTS